MIGKFTGMTAALMLACLVPSFSQANVIHFQDPSTQYDIGNNGFFAGDTDDGPTVISLSNWYSGLPENGFSFNHKHHDSGLPTSPVRVPEPDTFQLAAIGLIMVMCFAYRRRLRQ